MKRETKLWLRKRALMALRALIWHADEWVHRQEVKLREDLSGRKTRTEEAASASEKPVCREDMLHQRSGRPEGETFLQWEARRSGIAVVSKKAARRQRAITASAFDLRFAR